MHFALILALASAIGAAPPQPPSRTNPKPPSRTNEIYKWRPSKVDCATMASADGAELKTLQDTYEILDVNIYVPPTPHCYRPWCFSASSAGLYICNNNSEAVKIRGRYLGMAIGMVRDDCCTHEHYKDFPKSGTVDFPEAGVRVHVGKAECFNNNDWVNPLTIKGPNNCMLDVRPPWQGPLYLPGVNHTDAYE